LSIVSAIGQRPGLSKVKIDRSVDLNFLFSRMPVVSLVLCNKIISGTLPSSLLICLQHCPKGFGFALRLMHSFSLSAFKRVGNAAERHRFQLIQVFHCREGAPWLLRGSMNRGKLFNLGIINESSASRAAYPANYQIICVIQITLDICVCLPSNVTNRSFSSLPRQIKVARANNSSLTFLSATLAIGGLSEDRLRPALEFRVR
jgi:hypothetical protein